MTEESTNKPAESMIEAVARAIAGVEFDLPGAGGLRGNLTIARSREVARAAIAAMREPTEKVEDAARGLWLWYGGGRQPGWTLGKHSKTGGYGLSLTPEEAELDHCPKHVCGRIAWRTMIDAILNEGEVSDE